MHLYVVKLKTGTELFRLSSRGLDYMRQLFSYDTVIAVWDCGPVDFDEPHY